MRIAHNHVNSSTNRTSVRDDVDNPVGRYGVASNIRRSASLAAVVSSAAILHAAASNALLEPVATASARNNAAAARHTRAAGPASGSDAGRGHNNVTAGNAAAAAKPAPINRSDNCENGTGVATGNTNANNNAVALPASTELTTPENNTTNATASVATIASHVTRATAVPTQINAAHATANANCARNR
ncbi:hypothetical protein [Catenulispora sp. GP43]|uniref:hypothetical protein n=1 Tax=Catenulispora sp. GP43 TaxID=3156263 RepID=UPI003510F261